MNGSPNRTTTKSVSFATVIEVQEYEVDQESVTKSTKEKRLEWRMKKPKKLAENAAKKEQKEQPK